jgi:hypothetical protein
MATKVRIIEMMIVVLHKMIGVTPLIPEYQKYGSEFSKHADSQYYLIK